MLGAYIFPFSTNIWTSTQNYKKTGFLRCQQELREVLLSREVIDLWLRLVYIPRHISTHNSSTEHDNNVSTVEIINRTLTS